MSQVHTLPLDYAATRRSKTTQYQIFLYIDYRTPLELIIIFYKLINKNVSLSFPLLLSSFHSSCHLSNLLHPENSGAFGGLPLPLFTRFNFSSFSSYSYAGLSSSRDFQSSLLTFEATTVISAKSCELEGENHSRRCVSCT